jgi:carbonic anhydrase
MKTNGFDRRRFLRSGFAIAGAGFVWGAWRETALARELVKSPKTPDEALAELKAGNERYVTGRNLHHDFGSERAALAVSQHPFAIIFSCADSRVAPELAFDQSRGRLFVIRLAGNFVDDNGLASAEYGAAVLGAQLIVVLGHAECGAIKAAIEVITKKKVLPGHLPRLISYLEPPVKQALNRGGSLDDAVKENIRYNVTKLRNATPVIEPLIKENKARVLGAEYDLRTGRVTFLS